MHGTDATLRYVGPDGQALHVKRTSRGQQGDPLEMMRFCATIHPVWARVMARHPRARALAFADDGFVRSSVVECLHILAELKSTFKDDAKLDICLPKCKLYIKSLTLAEALPPHRGLLLGLEEVGAPGHSILQHDMPDEEPDCPEAKKHRLKLAGAAHMSCLTHAPVTTPEWEAWFCQFLGVPVMALEKLAREKRVCTCGRHVIDETATTSTPARSTPAVAMQPTEAQQQDGAGRLGAQACQPRLLPALRHLHRAEGARRLLLSSGTTLLAGAPGQCSGRRAQLKPPFPVPVGRGRSYTAPSASGGDRHRVSINHQ